MGNARGLGLEPQPLPAPFVDPDSLRTPAKPKCRFPFHPWATAEKAGEFVLGTDGLGRLKLQHQRERCGITLPRIGHRHRATGTTMGTATAVEFPARHMAVHRYSGSC